MPSPTPSRFVRREPTDPGAGASAFPSERVYRIDRAGARELDRLAAAEFGLPSIVLMENAALGLAREAIDMMAHAGLRSAVIVCGPGNNGGDGLALARHLHNAGAEVRVVLACPPGACRGDGAVHLGVADGMGIDRFGPEGFDRACAGPRRGLIVDALFGTGLDRAVEGPAAALIERINDRRAHGWVVLAADVPSGLDADTGRVLGVAVRADRTVTFAGVKPGLLALDAQGLVGEVVVAPIGCPRELLERVGTPIDPPPGPDRRV